MSRRREPTYGAEALETCLRVTMAGGNTADVAEAVGCSTSTASRLRRRCGVGAKRREELRGWQTEAIVEAARDAWRDGVTDPEAIVTRVAKAAQCTGGCAREALPEVLREWKAREKRSVRIG